MGFVQKVQDVELTGHYHDTITEEMVEIGREQDTVDRDGEEVGKYNSGQR